MRGPRREVYKCFGYCPIAVRGFVNRKAVAGTATDCHAPALLDLSSPLAEGRTLSMRLLALIAASIQEEHTFAFSNDIHISWEVCLLHKVVHISGR